MTKAQDPEIVVLNKNKDPPLEDVHYMTIGGVWNIKHDISSPKFYELFIKAELKRDTTLDPNIFYNLIKICLNAVIRL